MSDPVEISVVSLVGYNTGKPLVELSVGRETVVFDADKANQVGQWLIEAAVAARYDLALFNLLTDEVGLDVKRAGAVIAQLREKRVGA